MKRESILSFEQFREHLAELTDAVAAQDGSDVRTDASALERHDAALRTLSADLARALLSYDAAGKGRTAQASEALDAAEAAGIPPPRPVDPEEVYRPSTRPGGQGG